MKTSKLLVYVPNYTQATHFTQTFSLSFAPGSEIRYRKGDQYELKEIKRLPATAVGGY